MNNAILMQNLSKVLPNSALYGLDKKLENLSESQLNTLMIYKFKNPVLCLILSIFAGGWGVDRFYIGDIKWGIIKIAIPFAIVIIGLLLSLFLAQIAYAIMGVAFLAYMVFLIIDIFRVQKECKELNYQTFLNIIR
ncbi:hypothetical protein HMPREF9309_00789 [Campylobacter ureolyticus ACS-301-V-Sch3b]|uniref:TM2 domain-containing protein n=1 Tax=Campylobacter ureolyticus ACS-301-V-Sch3b TaxID=883165 RepID=S3YLB1_9BACT|nr:TM2 domain-containing protein [Campylobacter ureolyticus]EPH09270.1 hypothetical protein HMPREF9309_00789 [Campylobacter ureolyticus ACS-301-V-Sch3b]